VAVTKRIRAVAACLVFTALGPAQAAAVAAPAPDPGASTSPAPTPAPGPTPRPAPVWQSDVAPRVGLPELMPDPDPHPSGAPGTRSAPGHEMPPRPTTSAMPTREERDALLARVAGLGVVPVVDTSGSPVLTVDRQLVLTGKQQGLDAMRASGIEIAPGPRPGVSTVRSGGRIVAWYVLEDDPALAPPPASPPVAGRGSAGPASPGSPDNPESPESPEGPGSSGDAAGSDPGLPKTGPRGTALLAAAGLILVAGGAIAVRFATCRRRTRP
jgi:LPXTG-motif cell wall-anchored protein